MEVNTSNKAYLYTALMIIAEMVAFGLLALLGWFAAIVAYVTFFIFFVWKKYGFVLRKKHYSLIIVTISLLNIISALLSFTFYTMIADNIGFGAAFVTIFQNFGAYAIVFSISIALTVVFALFGFLSAYQYNKAVSKNENKEAQQQSEDNQ